MTLGEKQEKFAALEAMWVQWILSKGWRLRHGEGRILQLGPDGASGRRAREVGSGRSVRVKDLVHMDGGTHYLAVGADWNLFVDGKWISDGAHPAWQVAGEYWEGLDASCRWGGRWGDANHISLEHAGKK